jgi:ubiquinone/menaquinone biosynthesis C-methylase UbiE
MTIQQKTFLNPSKVLENLDLKSNMMAADFGCGSGGWVLPLAKKLEDGTVYAIDILEHPLSFLRKRLEQERIKNVRIINSDIEKIGGSRLPDSQIDLVLMTNLLFQCQNKKNVLSEGKRVLRKGGKVLIVDWVKDNPLTKEIEYVSFEEIKNIARDLGFSIEREFQISEYHKGLILLNP